MTKKADFTAEEWDVVLEGPTSAGMVVIAADRGGSIRESFSMAKAYVEARKHHGESELLDEVVQSKPEIEREHAHSLAELRDDYLENVRAAVRLVDAKATPEEAAEYRNFILTLADKVANARREGFLGLTGERVSEAEQAALDALAEAVGKTA
jgi:hypothetical protein